MTSNSTFAYVVRLVDLDKFGRMSSEEEAIVEAHFERLKKALAEDKLVLAGPCLDGAFGIVVFKAGSREEAECFMREDPAVKAGLMTAELHPFRVSLIQHSRST